MDGKGSRSSSISHSARVASASGIRGKRAGVLSIGSALVGSSCCLLPLALVFLGLSGGAFAVTMSRYSPILIPVGLLGLALAYYFYFRDARRCRASGCRAVGKRLNQVLLGVSTAIMLLVVATKVVPWADIGPAEARAENQMVFQVEGMTCFSCAFTIRQALEGLNGVKEANVSYWQQKATVTYDPNKVTRADVIERLSRLGYHAQLLQKLS
jgi:copper chaperone CopZ